jgi:hypothetical protein
MPRPLIIGNKFQRADVEAYDLEENLVADVKNYIRKAAEEGELDKLFEARLWAMDSNDLRVLAEAFAAHISDGMFDDAVLVRAKKLGLKEPE